MYMGKTIFCRTPEVRNIIESTGHKDVRILHGILNKEKIMNISDIDSESTKSEFGTSEDDTLIVFVGRLVPIKQPSVAVDIVGDLPEKYQMLMIGDGPEREQIEKQIRSEGLRSRIILTGELSHHKTLQLIKSSDVLLLTSGAEAYPTVVFEALALGSTVVAPPVGILSTIEHPRLHISNLESQAKELQQVRKGSSQVQQDIVQKFSIERYTSEILECTMPSGRM